MWAAPLNSSPSSRQIKNKIFLSPAVVVWLEIFLCDLVCRWCLFSKGVMQWRRRVAGRSSWFFDPVIYLVRVRMNADELHLRNRFLFSQRKNWRFEYRISSCVLLFFFSDLKKLWLVRIATTLLSCSEDWARVRYSIICYTFSFCWQPDRKSVV